MSVESARSSEQSKYAEAYRLDNYRMGLSRKNDAQKWMTALPIRGSYLDVGCGRGEMLTLARGLGFTPVLGVEVVEKLINGKTIIYGEAHNLPFPDKFFDVVSLWDVIEHLLPGDDEAVCKQMQRVARKHVLLTANNRPSHLPNEERTDLHINKRRYEEWDYLFRAWFHKAKKVTWLRDASYVSEGWRIDL